MPFCVLPNPILQLIGIFIDVDPVELRWIIRDCRDISFSSTSPCALWIGEKVTREDVPILFYSIRLVLEIFWKF